MALHAVVWLASLHSESRTVGNSGVMEDNLNHGEKMGELFHILMELIFRREWPSPIIVPFGMGNRHCMRRERWELEAKVNSSARKVLAPFLR